jgi:hypothetical protein
MRPDQHPSESRLRRAPHQSSTSALPVNAWQMIMTLSRASFSVPHVLYATGASRRTAPHSSSKLGTRKTSWSMRSAKANIVVEREGCGEQIRAERRTARWPSVGKRRKYVTSHRQHGERSSRCHTNLGGDFAPMP